jgi:alpha-beta hydrolase superfamily lysophospholipase
VDGPTRSAGLETGHWFIAGVDPVEFRVGSEVLRGEHWAPPPAAGPAKGAVVLVHGFNSSLEEFGHVPRWLSEAGLHALAFDQRGFGRSGGERGRTDVERAVQDVAAAGETLSRLAPGLPLGVIGHSLGGAYAAAAVGRGAIDAAAVVLAHPVDRLMDEVPAVLRPFYHALGRWGEWRMSRGKPPGHLPYRSSSRQLFVSLEHAQMHGRPPFLLKRSNLGNYRAARTMRASEWATGVRVPVLLVASPHDRVVRPEHSRAVHAAVAGPREVFEHGGGHSCFRDLDGRKVTDAMAAFFGRTLAVPR